MDDGLWNERERKGHKSHVVGTLCVERKFGKESRLRIFWLIGRKSHSRLHHVFMTETTIGLKIGDGGG